MARIKSASTKSSKPSLKKATSVNKKSNTSKVLTKSVTKAKLKPKSSIKTKASPVKGARKGASVTSKSSSKSKIPSKKKAAVKSKIVSSKVSQKVGTNKMKSASSVTGKSNKDKAQKAKAVKSTGVPKSSTLTKQAKSQPSSKVTKKANAGSSHKTVKNGSVSNKAANNARSKYNTSNVLETETKSSKKAKSVVQEVSKSSIKKPAGKPSSNTQAQSTKTSNSLNKSSMLENLNANNSNGNAKTSLVTTKKEATVKKEAGKIEAGSTELNNGSKNIASEINQPTLEEADAPVKRKRGRPRKSDSVNGSASGSKLAEKKGVKRFGMTYGRPGVAAGRYAWSAETGNSLNSLNSLNAKAEEEKEELTLEDEIEIISDHYVNFEEGDKVVYPAHGLGIIEAIQTRTVGGSHQKFFMITIVETGMKIMVPVGQAKTVGLRMVVDKSTVEKVYDILKDKNVVIDNQTWNRRYREYSQKIKTGSVLEIASVIRDLTVLRIEKELSFNERRMLDTAQGLLVKELSIAKASSEDSIKEELDLICQP